MSNPLQLQIERERLAQRIRQVIPEEMWISQITRQREFLDVLWTLCPEAMVAADRQLSRCGDYVFGVWSSGLFASGGHLGNAFIDWDEEQGTWQSTSPSRRMGHLVDP